MDLEKLELMLADFGGNNKPDNLAWGTAKDNADDRSRHGRTAFGERNGFSKLSDKARADIVKRVVNGESPTKLARQHGVTVSNIYKIKARAERRD